MARRWIIVVVGVAILPFFWSVAVAEEEVGDASADCEGYSQSVEVDDGMTGHMRPVLDTRDTFSFAIDGSMLTASDTGDLLTQPAGRPAHMTWVDANGNTVKDGNDWIYLVTNAAPAFVALGDVRISNNNLNGASGTQVAAGNGDVGLPATTLGGAGGVFDADADFFWTLGDSLYWDADSSGTISFLDVRLTPQGSHAAGTIVSPADTDVGFSLLPHSTDFRIFDVDESGSYGLGDRTYVDMDSNSIVSGMDVRLHTPQFGTVVVGKRIWIPFELEPGILTGTYELAADVRGVEVMTQPTGEKRTCQASVVAPEGNISADVSNYDCSSGAWRFVINQLKKGNAAPTSIHVTWDNGDEADIPIEKQSKKTAHYATSLNLDATVTAATASIYEGWKGKFKLASGPCNSGLQQADELGDLGGLHASIRAMGPAALRTMGGTTQPAPQTTNGHTQSFNTTVYIAFEALTVGTVSVQVTLVETTMSASAAQSESTGMGCHDANCVEYLIEPFLEALGVDCDECPPSPTP